MLYRINAEYWNNFGLDSYFNSTKFYSAFINVKVATVENALNVNIYPCSATWYNGSVTNGSSLYNKFNNTIKETTEVSNILAQNVEFEITDIVEQWIDNPSSRQYGFFMMVDGEGDGAAGPECYNQLQVWQTEDTSSEVYLVIDYTTFESGIVHTIKNTTQNRLIKSQRLSVISSAFDYSDLTLMWKFDYVGDGYYMIINEASGEYLCAPNSNTDGDLILTISYNLSNRPRYLWRFTSTSDGYRIQSKNQYDRGATTPLYLAISGGSVVQSSIVTNSTWSIQPLTLKLNVLYDQAFIDRYGTSNYRSILNAIFLKNPNGKSLSGILKEYCGINVEINHTYSVFSSYPYVQNCTHKNAIDEICYDCKNATFSTNEINDCNLGHHHKSTKNLLASVPNTSLETSTQINILFTGYAACEVLFGTHAINETKGLTEINTNSIAIFTNLFANDLSQSST